MTKVITYSFVLFLCYSCADNKGIEQKLMVEKSESLIVERSTKKTFTGHVNLTNEEGINFKGFVKDGKREGECSWIKTNGDTLEYQRFHDGEVIYSVQFNINGKRDVLWIQSNPPLEKKDTVLIDDVIKLLLESKYTEIGERIVSRDLPYADLIGRQMSEFNSDLGALHNIEILEITKKAYNFRPEKYLELKTIFKFDITEVLMGVRLLENENNLHSVEVWEIKSKMQKEYLDFNIWSFMNL
ncbi:MAG: hypothetical protein HRT58_14550 [Crocinitomicaceae bacterium]|nr:hypothetical protein [Flavobacteriales bacterium]NQZ36887.1 hypothetical protein [Crocinitomicaceae bacterium]